MKSSYLYVFVLIFLSNANAYAKVVGTVPKVLKATSATKELKRLDDSLIKLNQITKTDLASYSKTENILKLLGKAHLEGRLSTIEKLKYQKSYQKVIDGDDALLHCLKHKTCDLEKFSNLIDKTGNNQLHRHFSYKYPNNSLQSIYKMSGRTTEKLMIQYFQRSGWERIEGEIGVTGIDGLFIKRNNAGDIIDVLVVESKYNQSLLMPRKSGHQMSKTWILNNLTKLERKHPEQKDYSAIKQFVNNDSYRSRLWKMNLENNNLVFNTKKIHSKGDSINKIDLIGREKGKIEYKGNSSIDINNPKNKFHQDLISDFVRIINET